MAVKFFTFSDAQNETENINSVLRRLGRLSQEELDRKQKLCVRQLFNQRS